MNKQCFKCGKVKPSAMFYKHKKMADGHLNKCIECTKMDSAARYRDPESRKRIRAYESARNKTPERRAAKALYQLRVREMRPGAIAARNSVARALKRGLLTRKPCEVCGDIKSEAHHNDYRRRLHVRWLCFKHHREAHGQKVGD